MKALATGFSGLLVPFAVTVFLWVFSPVAPAQPTPDGALVRGESAQTRKRLTEAEQKLRDGQTVEVTAELIALLTEAGDDLVSTDGRSFRPARRDAHALLARLPADALRAYRGRADAPARQLLARGKEARDPRPLRELIDRYFASRPAEEALLLLGELAFERGEFRRAEAYWLQFLPGGDGPTFPDPTTDPAAVRARIALARLFAGDTDRARAELAILKAQHPTAKGRLAGKTGPYVSTLEALLAGPPPTLPPPTTYGDWPTFANGFARSGSVSGPLPTYWPPSPAWKTPIPQTDDPPPDRTRSVVGSGRECAFHPVSLNGRAYIADAGRVIGFDPRTGKSSVAFDWRPAVPNVMFDLALPQPPGADFTLTAADGRLFARFGPPSVAATSPDGQQHPSRSVLVALAPNGDVLKKVWSLPAPADAAGVPGVWEGAPVVAGGRVIAAFARFEGNRTVHAIAAYDDPPGRPLWSADVAETTGAADPRPRPELLTLAGGNVVFCTQTGVIAAVDAASGRPAWAYRYPRKPPATGVTSPRDLCPPVADAGRVFIAPADAEFVFAFDAMSGKLLWDAGPVQVEQLLGVTRGRLIATTLEPSRGVRAMSVATGSHREPEGWTCHDDPFLRSYGRGLVSPDLVLWPTGANEGTFLLNASDGTRATGLCLNGARGNLAYADGVLLVASPTEVWGYVLDRRDETPMNAAERLAASGNKPAAVSAFRVIAASQSGSDRDRVRAAARLAVLDRSGEPADDFFHRIGLPFSLRNRWVLSPHGRPVPLREFVANPTANPAVPLDGTFPRRKPPDPRDPLTVPSLGPSAAVAKEVPFPTAGCVPLLPFTGDDELPGLNRDVPEPLRRLLVTDGVRLYGYRPGDDRPTWLADLPSGLRATHATAIGERLIVAGPAGVALLRFTDGVTQTDVRIPDGDPLPPFEVAGQPVPRSAGLAPTSPGLNGFTLSGSRVVARVGDHHLIAIDVSAGRVAWVLDGNGRSRLTHVPFPGAPMFDAAFSVDVRTVVAHLSDGRRWSVALDTGRVVAMAPSALAEWPGPPAVIGNGVVAVADGPGTVRAVDSATGRVRWTFDAGGDASLTGRPPRLREHDGSVLVAVSRNHGIEVDRLWGTDGSRLWRTGPAFVPADDLDLANAAADDTHLYLSAGGRVTALRWKDGGFVWSADLDAEVGGAGVEWRLTVGRRGLLAVPVAAVPVDSPSEVFARAGRRLLADPAAWRLPQLAAGVYDAWAVRSLPVLVLDPATGAVRHRLDLPATGPATAVKFTPDAAVVATIGKAYWLR